MVIAGTLMAGLAGYYLGRHHSGTSGFIESDSAGAGNTEQRRWESEMNSNGGAAKGATTSSTRLRLGTVESASWHQYQGPFTAESWMVIRQAVLSTPLNQVEDTLAKLQDLPVGQERLELQREILAMWATRDPIAALNYAADIDIRNERGETQEDILRVWASSDPKAAFDWLESQQEVMTEREYNRIFDDAIRGYADLDLSQAIDYFNQISGSLDDRSVRRGLDGITKSLIQQGRLDQALDLLNQFEDPDVRKQASYELMAELAAVDLDQALTLLESYDGMDSYSGMQRELVTRWAVNDPAEAADYISSRVEIGEDFTRMATQVITNWNDLGEASEWLAQYDPSPELDRPTMALAYRASREDPAGAMSWASSVTDDQRQNRAIRMIAANWKSNDEASVKQYLAQNPDLTPEQIKLIEETPARPFYNRSRGSSR